MNQEKTLKLVEAVTLYSSGIDHSEVMDWLTIECTDSEWDFITEALRRVDEIKVDNGIGTIWQTESILAKREGRKHRYPSIFSGCINQQESDKRKAELASEFRQRGIKFSEAQ